MQICIGETTYNSGKITAAMTRRALELNVEALDAATKAQELEKCKDATLAGALLAAIESNINAKARLICDVFEGAFDEDTLMNNVSNGELNVMTNKIAMGKN